MSAPRARAWLEPTLVIASPPQSSDTHAATVARARAGEPGALTALIEQHERPLYHFILSLVRQGEDASDVAQDVWFEVSTHLPALRDVDRFRPWLYRIARNRCLRLIRARRKTVGSATEQPVEFDACDHPGRTVEEQVLSLDERRKVWEALGSLSKQDRMALFLRDQLELPYTEVAEVLGVTRNAAQVRVFRARERFRQHFEAVDAAAADCELSLLQLGAFVDGSLSVESAEWVRGHLASCTPCSDRVLSMHEGRRLYRQLGLVASPPGLLAAVLAQSQLAVSGAVSGGLVTTIGWKLAAAVVALLAVAVSGAPDVAVHLPPTAVEAATQAAVAAPATADARSSAATFVLDPAADTAEPHADESDLAASTPTPASAVATDGVVPPAGRPATAGLPDLARGLAATTAVQGTASAEPAPGISAPAVSSAPPVQVDLPIVGSVVEPALAGIAVAVAIPELPIVLPRTAPDLTPLSPTTETVETALDTTSALAAELPPLPTPAVDLDSEVASNAAAARPSAVPPVLTAGTGPPLSR